MGLDTAWQRGNLEVIVQCVTAPKFAYRTLHLEAFPRIAPPVLWCLGPYLQRDAERERDLLLLLLFCCLRERNLQLAPLVGVRAYSIEHEGAERDPLVNLTAGWWAGFTGGWQQRQPLGGLAVNDSRVPSCT